MQIIGTLTLKDGEQLAPDAIINPDAVLPIFWHEQQIGWTQLEFKQTADGTRFIGGLQLLEMTNLPLCLELGLQPTSTGWQLTEVSLAPATNTPTVISQEEKDKR